MKKTKYLKYRNIFLIGLSIILVLTLVLPSYATWLVTERDAYWETVNLIEEETFVLLHLPFYILFPISRLIKYGFFRWVINVILILFSCYYFLLGLPVIIPIPIPDFIPLYGTALSLTILPGLILVLYLDWMVKNEEVKDIKVLNP